jgi:EAL domain-containing protein (putative c-di-GMP-specific phosphodiesterase class I)/CheY-like chemotaxis protein
MVWRVLLASAPRLENARRRVLLVDDDELLLAALARALTQNGYQVTKAASVSRAMAAVTTAAFDVIVSDIHMPELSGIDLIKQVRRHDSDVPVVLMTGKPTIETAVAAVEAGALQYLVKPTDADVLCTVVARAATLHQLALTKRRALALQGMFAAAPGDRASLELSLDSALETLYLAFQPIVDRRGVVAGYEALLRSRESTLPNPGAIIGAAERLGRLPEIGRRVRMAAAGAVAAAPPEALLFLNLHARDLADEMLYDGSEAISRIARRVILEVTERVSLEVVKDVSARVAALRLRGFRVALDDLGAGYAGLTSFALLEPEFVKLDLSLVRDIHRSPVKQAVVESMTRLCHELSIRVVAEGVETAQERDCLRALSCDYFQGYFFARPSEGFVSLPLP